jgi:anti-sigma regulatory factor (Ser/Thr protein kinase)
VPAPPWWDRRLVVQEGLTNAVKYAAGQSAVIGIAYRNDHVEAEVTKHHRSGSASRRSETRTVRRAG